MGFENLTTLFRAGDPLKSASTNRPLQTLDANQRYLYDLLRAAAAGATVYARQEKIESAALVGMPVWYNPSSGAFERGLAVADVDASSGAVYTPPRAQIWGIVASKSHDTVGDILLYGVDEVDISLAVSETLQAGTYYLSGVSPGKLTRARPPVPVVVLRVLGDGRVFVMPQFVEFLDRHTHYRFDLVCRPAGNHATPAPGDRHVITNADDSLPGWLPADHPTFEGTAPTGAMFGYNFKADAALRNAWPPLPASNAVIEWDRGEDPASGAVRVPAGLGGLVVTDVNGIWWMSDCYNDVPWPMNLDTSLSTSASLSDSNTTPTPECPRFLSMSVTLWFTRVNFATDATTVMSLGSRDSRIKVVCAGTNRPANSGGLELLLDLAQSIADDGTGFLVIKNFDPATGKYSRGPVAEGLYALSDTVTLTGQHVTREFNGVPREFYQGPVGIAILPATSAELDVQIVRLGTVTEEHYDDTLYLGFAAGVTRNYRAKVHIPNNLEIANPKLSFVFEILGRAAGTLPQLTITARRVPRPSDGLTTPADLPTSSDEFAVTCTTVATLTDANQYVEAVSVPFTVAAGETIFFTVQRSGGDAYSGELGILKQIGVVSSGG